MFQITTSVRSLLGTSQFAGNMSVHVILDPQGLQPSDFRVGGKLLSEGQFHMGTAAVLVLLAAPQGATTPTAAPTPTPNRAPAATSSGSKAGNDVERIAETKGRGKKARTETKAPKPPKASNFLEYYLKPFEFMFDTDLDVAIEILGLRSSDCPVISPSPLKGLLAELARDGDLLQESARFLAELRNTPRMMMVVHVGGNHYVLLERLSATAAVVWDSQPPPGGISAEVTLLAEALDLAIRSPHEVAGVGYPRQSENECALCVLRQAAARLGRATLSVHLASRSALVMFARQQLLERRRKPVAGAGAPQGATAVLFDDSDSDQDDVAHTDTRPELVAAVTKRALEDFAIAHDRAFRLHVPTLRRANPRRQASARTRRCSCSIAWSSGLGRRQSSRTHSWGKKRWR